MPLTRLPSASTARKMLAEPEGDARWRWRPSRTTRLRTVAGARPRPAANASKQAGATTYASPSMLYSQAPTALTGTEPSRSPARTQLIHSQPAPSPPITDGGVRSGGGSGAAVGSCGASGRSAAVSSAGGAGGADKGKPVSPTYLDLWYRTYNNDSFVIAAKPHEMAFYAGFSGQRAQNTWMARIRQLVDLGCILISDGASGPAHYILILNPYHVIRRHIDEGKIQAAFANALAERMLEIGADDLDNTSVQD